MFRFEFRVLDHRHAKAQEYLNRVLTPTLLLLLGHQSCEHLKSEQLNLQMKPGFLAVIALHRNEPESLLQFQLPYQLAEEPRFHYLNALQKLVQSLSRALQPIDKVIEIAGEIPVHSDAVQSLLKIPVSFVGLTALTLSAHKIGGPVGIGALVLKRGLDIPALLHGGGQEREIRSGTLNTAAICAFAAALTTYPSAKISALRDRLITGIKSLAPDALINTPANSLPGIVNASFPGTKGETLLLLMDMEGIACSTGSACSAGVHRPSHVLLALGRTEDQAIGTLRFSLGAQSTDSDVDKLLQVLPGVIEKARLAK